MSVKDTIELIAMSVAYIAILTALWIWAHPAVAFGVFFFAAFAAAGAGNDDESNPVEHDYD